MAKKSLVGVNNVAKLIPNKGYIGVNNQAKKLIKGYVGDENGLARLFWELGGGIDDNFVAKFKQNYVIGNVYTLTFADIEKSIKYIFVRGYLLSEGIDSISNDFLIANYRNIDEIVSRVKAVMIENDLNYFTIDFNTELPDGTSRTSIAISLAKVQSTGWQCDDCRWIYGAFRYEFENVDAQVQPTFSKYIVINLYSSGVYSIGVYDISGYVTVSSQCATDSRRSYELSIYNAGIEFENKEGTDLVDSFDFRNAVVAFVYNSFSWILSNYTLDSVQVITDSSRIDANGITFLNDVSWIVLPLWWIYDGLYYIELDIGYMPSSVATVSNYIYLLSFSSNIGIAYNKSQGVWGVWDYENNQSVFKSSGITAIDYFANKKVKIIFDISKHIIKVLRNEDIAFILSFTYSDFDELYVGGRRTTSSQIGNCISGMVIKTMKAYKNHIKRLIPAQNYVAGQTYTIYADVSFSDIMEATYDLFCEYGYAINIFYFQHAQYLRDHWNEIKTAILAEINSIGINFKSISFLIRCAKTTISTTDKCYVNVYLGSESFPQQIGIYSVSQDVQGTNYYTMNGGSGYRRPKYSHTIAATVMKDSYNIPSAVVSEDDFQHIGIYIARNDSGTFNVTGANYGMKEN